MVSNILAQSRMSKYIDADNVCKEIERINTIDMKSQMNIVKTVKKIQGMYVMNYITIAVFLV